MLVEPTQATATPPLATTRRVVASQFQVKGAVVTSYQRHDQLSTALAAAGLDEERDDVIERLTS